MAATADSLRTSTCFLMFGGENPRGPFIQFVADARPPKNAAAARVEELYNGFSVGTDAEGNEGYNAAQKAEEQLKLDFLSSFQNPQKNSANQTAWDEEEAQLISDSLKYGGDRALDAAAIYWGETHLNLPVLSPQELLAQAKTMQIADQPGEREFADRVAPRSRRAHAVEVDISEGRRGRIVIATQQTINGKRVMVQRRKAFAVFVGERPVKPGRRDSLREAQRKISRRIVTLLGQA